MIDLILSQVEVTQEELKKIPVGLEWIFLLLATQGCFAEQNPHVQPMKKWFVVTFIKSFLLQ